MKRGRSKKGEEEVKRGGESEIGGEESKKGGEGSKKVGSVSPHLMLAALVKRSLFVRQQVDTSKVCLSLIQLSDNYIIISINLITLILSPISWYSKVCFTLITL